MKKKIIFVVTVFCMLTLNFLISGNSREIDSTLELEMKTAQADGETTYFNPDIPYPEDPCDTGGISVCYGK